VIESVHPSVLVTIRITSKVPAELKICDGFCIVDVLLTPEVGSPNSQYQLNKLFPPLMDDRSLNCTGCWLQAGVKLKSAMGLATIITSLKVLFVQLSESVTVRITWNVPGLLYKCAILGSSGNTTV